MSNRPDRRRRRPSDVPPGPDDWTVADSDEPTLTRVEGPTALSGELARITRRPGWGERLGAARVWAAWEEMVGPELAAHCEPVRLAGRVLVVRVDSPAWSTQLRYLTSQLIERAEAALGPGSVRDVRVTVGPLEGRADGRGAGDGAAAGPVGPGEAPGGVIAPYGGRRAAAPAPFGHPDDPDASEAPR
jgi:predicted nucleic acid-binding Zn ribbon protein